MEEAHGKGESNIEVLCIDFIVFGEVVVFLGNEDTLC